MSLPSSVIPDRFVDLKSGKEKILQIAVSDSKKALESNSGMLDFALPFTTGSESKRERDQNHSWIINQALKDSLYLTYQNDFERVGSTQLFISPTGEKHQENGILYNFSDQNLERLDPKYPRPKTDELTNPFVADFVLANMRLCFDATSKNIAKISSLDPQKIDRLSEKELSDLFSDSANACFAATNSPVENADQIQQTSEALVTNQLALQSQRKEAFNAMTLVCTKCHGPNFIPLPIQDPKAFLKFTGDIEGKTPLEMILEEKMPPPYSPYKIDPDTRKRWVNLLQQMSE